MKKTNQLQTLKGFRDFLPEEAIKRQWLEKRLRQVFESWGYDPLETPTLESLALFKGQVGEGEKLFFKFKDPGGREVALRYDQTVPVCRVVGQYGQQLAMPFRRYQIQSCFRAEKPQKGRYREFTHCDADIFGIQSPIADAEVIALSLDIYRQLDFKEVKVLINDRELLKNLPYKAIISLDKLKKIGKDGVLKTMENEGINLAKAKEYLSFVKKLKPNKTLEVIFNYLKDFGFKKDWYAFSPTLARSFSYSTGPIWEVEISGFTAGSVLGGERFDNLVRQLSGLDIPGTGFAVGFDRTLEAAEQFGLIPQLKTLSQLLVTIFSANLLNDSLKAAVVARKAGLKTELYPDANVRLDKQLKYANKKGVPFVLIVGPDEIKQNKVTLKDMRSGEQKTLSIEEGIKIVNGK